MALSGVRGDVTQGKVQTLLLARQSDLLEAGNITAFEQRVKGSSVAVVLLVGEDPAAGMLRELAAEAIATEVAAEIEYAEYPEQQAPGDTGRGYHLHQRYLELLALLRGYVQSGTTDGYVGVPAPVGSFPPARCYPDPVDQFCEPDPWTC